MNIISQLPATAAKKAGSELAFLVLGMISGMEALAGYCRIIMRKIMIKKIIQQLTNKITRTKMTKKTRLKRH